MQRLVVTNGITLAHNCHPRAAYVPTIAQILDIAPSHACGQTLTHTIS